jgi:hypothetical protein
MNRRKAFGFLTFLCIATVAMCFMACSKDDNPTGPQAYKGVPLLIAAGRLATLPATPATNSMATTYGTLPCWRNCGM